ncbi:hypothetical protein HUJ04_009962 [Dendroctonus ponderosae]|nr:hypothetical protein HUJ04_009962 [Dendroctonus ponderosae]KAH1020267.1 hypothetical protein HUJ04_009962 [Dendroctonus ponderosae]KAH1020268.1 hypothetical protein HUJ04_009962 [Dendroctonus ponderosae]
MFVIALGQRQVGWVMFFLIKFMRYISFLLKFHFFVRLISVTDKLIFADYFKSICFKHCLYFAVFGFRWIYSDASRTKSIRYWLSLTSYYGGGFYADFSLNLNESMTLLDTLQENLWITRGTRAVFVDFSVYNANLNLYCICKIIFEFLPPGGVSPAVQFTPAALTPVGNIWDWILRILLYCFSAYIMYCLCEEIREMVHFKGTYFIQFWNYVDLIIIMLTCLLVVGTEYMRAVLALYIEEILHNPTRYGNLETPGIIYQVVKTSGAVLLFFVYLRTFKYLNFSRRMAQLNNTIRNCSKDILGFSVMFFVAYFAYAELGYLVFGSQTDEFRSFGQSMFTLLRTILGDFDYEKISNANWIVAPVYFLTYIILVFFVLLNMFLAIINDTYADVKIDIAIAPKKIEMSECDFDDREIEMYFKRYDIDPLKDLQKEDIERFYEMFAQEDLARKRGEENIVTWKGFQKQDDKLVELENTLAMVGQKVHDILRLIEGIQDAHPKPLLL